VLARLAGVALTISSLRPPGGRVPAWNLRKLVSALTLLFLVCAVFAAEEKPEALVSGQPNRGLVSRIEIKERKFAVGAPIVMSQIVRNVGEKPLTVWHSGFWSNHQIRVCDQDGKLVPLTPAGKERLGAFSPGGERTKNISIELKPGEEDVSDGANRDVTALYDLTTPGIYSVQALYEEYQGNWEGQLWSNVIVIQIVAK
jgi:hypothetical protein